MSKPEITSAGGLIDALGGTTEVAKAMGLEASAVSNWRVRGLPYRLHARLARLCAEHKLTLPANFFEGQAREGRAA